jgi:predicted Zn-dependent protease
MIKNTFKTLLNFVILLSIGFAAFNISGCATVPITGRKQLAFIPTSDLAMMAEDSYKQLLQQSVLSDDVDKINLLRKVGKKISRAAEDFLVEQGLQKDLKYYKWEYNLIENDDVINAFAMPGGKIAFYTGIFKLFENEDQVAVVMGHEVAHAIAKHGNERMSQQLAVQLGGIALSSALKTEPEATQRIFMSVYGIGSEVGVLLPYSRKHEYEADEIGLIFMVKAGYEPMEAVKFWEKMAALGGAGVPEFLSTHPSGARRVANLKRLVPKARNYQPPAK